MNTDMTRRRWNRVRSTSYSSGRLFMCLLAAYMSACTTTTIDEYRREAAVLESGQSMVVLGRRVAGDYETEPWIVSCIGNQLGRGKNALNVMEEQEFQDRLYPWFEPRTAPLSMPRLQAMLKEPHLAEEVEKMGLRYIVWVDGATQRGESAGSMSCAISPGGAGCLGFGTWEDDAHYKVAVWDIDNPRPLSELEVVAEGTSYMPAVVVPVPLIARVKSSVCSSLTTQIKGMFPES